MNDLADTNSNGNNHRFDGVFLDFYGTLASGDVQAVEAICQEVITDHGLQFTAPELAKQWGHRYFAAIEDNNGKTNGDGRRFRNLKQIETDTLIETIEPLCGRISVDHYIQSLNVYLAQPTLYEEVREVLAALRLPICIVSNADDEELLAAIEHHGLHFDYVVSSESSSSYKPDTGIFQAALDVTGWEADRVIHVGDSLHSDVGGAHAAGLKAAWVSRSIRISDIGTDTPDYTWTDLKPLIGLTSGR